MRLRRIEYIKDNRKPYVHYCNISEVKMSTLREKILDLTESMALLNTLEFRKKRIESFRDQLPNEFPEKMRDSVYRIADDLLREINKKSPELKEVKRQFEELFLKRDQEIEWYARDCVKYSNESNITERKYIEHSFVKELIARHWLDKMLDDRNKLIAGLIRFSCHMAKFMTEDNRCYNDLYERFDSLYKSFDMLLKDIMKYGWFKVQNDDVNQFCKNLYLDLKDDIAHETNFEKTKILIHLKYKKEIDLSDSIVADIAQTNDNIYAKAFEYYEN